MGNGGNSRIAHDSGSYHH
jgi:hypothetical protein